jgi:glutamate-1-semialdehyde 2,1-aminomutase
LKDTAIPFNYNIASFNEVYNKHRSTVAAVVMEPVRNFWPEKGFLEGVRDVTEQDHVPMVFDEVTSCLRMTPGGIHLKLGIIPDVAVLAKALGNGYPMAAVMGKAWIMQAAQSTFISSTFWTDKIGPVAALATLRKHRRLDVSSRLVANGNAVQAGWKKLGEKYGLDIHISGIPPLSHWQIECPESQLLHTIITEKMVDKGFLTSKAYYATYMHTEKQIKAYIDALDAVLGELTPYIKANTVAKLPHGPIAHSGFKRLT